MSHLPISKACLNTNTDCLSQEDLFARGSKDRIIPFTMKIFTQNTYSFKLFICHFGTFGVMPRINLCSQAVLIPAKINRKGR